MQANRSTTQRHPVTLRIAKAITELNAVPVARRDADFRIAKGLLEESVGLVRAGNWEMADKMREAALPYLRFAELV